MTIIYVHFFSIGDPLVQKVEFLIDNDRCRNVERLHEWFVEADVMDIPLIPLSHSIDEDKFFWFNDTKGFYSVRSGYNLANRLACGLVLGSSSGSYSWYRVVWNLNIPNKVKHYMERMHELPWVLPQSKPDENVGRL